jgi:hypothetical protein
MPRLAQMGALRVALAGLTTGCVVVSLFGSWMEYTARGLQGAIRFQPYRHVADGELTYLLVLSSTSWLTQDAAVLSGLALIATCVAVGSRHAVIAVVSGVLQGLTAVQVLQAWLFFVRNYSWFIDRAQLQFEGTFFYGFGFAIAASVLALVCVAVEFYAASKGDPVREPEFEGAKAKHAELELPA